MTRNRRRRVPDESQDPWRLGVIAGRTWTPACAGVFGAFEGFSSRPREKLIPALCGQTILGRMQDCRLFSPPPWLPLYLLPVWPLIWWRLRQTWAWFCANGHPGAQMLWEVDSWGRVRVLLVSDNLRRQGQAHLNVPAPSRGFVLMCQSSADPCAGRDLVLQRPGRSQEAPAFAGGAEYISTLTRLPGERGFPPPDT